MRLQLDPSWAIDWDGQCYTLIHFTVITGEGKGAKKTKAENIGKLRENLCGYYGSNLRQVIGAYVSKAALEGDGTADISKLIDKLDQLDETIKNLKVAFVKDAPEPTETPKPAIAVLDL